MANPEHLSLLQQGVAIWNEWRIRNPGSLPDLSGTNLSDASLSESNLGGANLSGAKLIRANLYGADLKDTDLRASVKSLSSDQSQRQITLEAAEFVLRTIVTAVLGSNTAHQLEIDFGSDNLPALSELWSALSDACVAAGWTALVEKGKES